MLQHVGEQVSGFEPWGALRGYATCGFDHETGKIHSLPGKEQGRQTWPLPSLDPGEWIDQPIAHVEMKIGTCPVAHGPPLMLTPEKAKCAAPIPKVLAAKCSE